MSDELREQADKVLTVVQPVLDQLRADLAAATARAEAAENMIERERAHKREIIDQLMCATRGRTSTEMALAAALRLAIVRGKKLSLTTEDEEIASVLYDLEGGRWQYARRWIERRYGSNGEVQP